MYTDVTDATSGVTVNVIDSTNTYDAVANGIFYTETHCTIIHIAAAAFWRRIPLLVQSCVLPLHK